MSHTLLGAILVGLLLDTGCSQLARRPEPYRFTTAQRRAVEHLLAARPGWRLATLADNRADDLAEQLREHPGYEPYFVQWPGGDRPDFAIVLMRGDECTVYWFRAEVGRYRPVEVTRAAWLRTAGLFLQGDTLEVAPFHSDEIFAFAWDSAANRPVLLPADSGEP